MKDFAIDRPTSNVLLGLIFDHAQDIGYKLGTFGDAKREDFIKSHKFNPCYFLEFHNKRLTHSTNTTLPIISLDEFFDLTNKDVLNEIALVNCKIRVEDYGITFFRGDDQVYRCYDSLNEFLNHSMFGNFDLNSIEIGCLKLERDDIVTLMNLVKKYKETQ